MSTKTSIKPKKPIAEDEEQLIGQRNKNVRQKTKYTRNAEKSEITPKRFIGNETSIYLRRERFKWKQRRFVFKNSQLTEKLTPLL